MVGFTAGRAYPSGHEELFAMGSLPGAYTAAAPS